MKDTFSDLYIYFSESYLTPVRTKAECDLIEHICELRMGDHILDIGCGHGRISNELADRSYSVTGIDWNQRALDIAAKKASKKNIYVCYENKIGLGSEWTNRFDCALSWYTSFGYTDDESCHAQLREIYATLKEGGRLLIDHINRDLSLKSLPASSIHRRGSDLMIDEFEYDNQNGRLYISRQFILDGETTHAPYNIRLFSFTEIESWMRQVGFRNIKGYDRHGKKFKIDSDRMMLVGIK